MIVMLFFLHSFIYLVYISFINCLFLSNTKTKAITYYTYYTQHKDVFELNCDEQSARVLNNTETHVVVGPVEGYRYWLNDLLFPLYPTSIGDTDLNSRPRYQLETCVNEAKCQCGDI